MDAEKVRSLVNNRRLKTNQAMELWREAVRTDQERLFWIALLGANPGLALVFAIQLGKTISKVTSINQYTNLDSIMTLEDIQNLSSSGEAEVLEQ